MHQKANAMQGSYQAWKTWKIMDFYKFSRPEVLWKLGMGREMSWKIMGKLLCSSRKYPYPPPSPHRGSLEIPRGRGPKKPKFLKGSMKQNWNFQRGGVVRLKTKKPLWEGYGYFLEQHILGEKKRARNTSKTK